METAISETANRRCALVAHSPHRRFADSTMMDRPVNQFVSRRALVVDASGIRKVFDLAAKLKDPINFSIGLPDFDVPEPAKKAAIDAIRSGQNRYTVTQGIVPLSEK